MLFFHKFTFFCGFHKKNTKSPKQPPKPIPKSKSDG